MTQVADANHVDPDDPAVDRYLVLFAFGETVLRFQLVEMSLWSILAMRLKRGTTLEQGMTKLAGWDLQTMGRLVGVLGLPDELKAEADESVETRNYLVHRYMRERATFLHDSEFCRRVAQELADVQARLDEFEHRLDEYMQNLGVPELTDEELEALGMTEPPDPETWFGSDSAD
jgi:hypothetical protein